MPVIATDTRRVAGHLDLVRKGRAYDEKSDVVKKYPGLFVTPEEWARRSATPHSTAELADRSMSAPVERTTAAPGEKRSTRRKKTEEDS